MNAALESVRLLVAAPAHYRTCLARTPADVRAAQVLRFEVFNLELNESLASSHATGLDADPFDAVCDHLLVELLPTGQIVQPDARQKTASGLPIFGLLLRCSLAPQKRGPQRIFSLLAPCSSTKALATRPFPILI